MWFDLKNLILHLIKGTFTTRFWLTMTWLDSRVTFVYLNKVGKTLLSNEDIEKLWIPRIGFQTTPSISGKNTKKYY